MKHPQFLGETLVAFCAVGVVLASTSSAAPTFLLAEWLADGVPLTVPLLAEASGELTLTNLNGGGLGLRFEILCTRFLAGTVGPGSASEITDLLDGPHNPISLEILVGPHLLCSNIAGCAEPSVWAEELPWTMELELMEDGAETLFVGSRILERYHTECAILGVKITELCEATSTAIKITNEGNGVVGAEFNAAFQNLAAQKFGECGDRAETLVLEGLETMRLDGRSLVVSSGA